MRLSGYFEGIASKRLSAVEVSPSQSNQHEFNGVQTLVRLLGSERRRLDATFLYLAEEDVDRVAERVEVTWYDARERHPTRSECRLYYSENEVMRRAGEGDLLVIALLPDRRLLAVVAESGSTAENQVRHLFALGEVTPSFHALPGGELSLRELDFAAEWVLEQIGVEPRVGSQDELLRSMLGRFNGGFPGTEAFSAFARECADPTDPVRDPDGALLTWISHELRLFRVLERYLVADRIAQGFGGPPPDVDAFLAYSLSIQNRRKARAGRALENHISFILRCLKIPFSYGARTERKSRPDFLFPSEAAYHDEAFPDAKLAMLAAKSTCKERWRQILAEADRIREKHLLTLEPGISADQTDEMESQLVRLVIPAPLHTTYSPRQRTTIWCLRQFLEWVKHR